jgi:hypothetical protein
VQHPEQADNERQLQVQVTDGRVLKWLRDGIAYRPSVPFPSVFKRIGAPRLEEPTFLLLLLGLELVDGVVAVGVEGNGFAVALDRALSVLELVIELKRELGSFLAMVTVTVTGRTTGSGCSSTSIRVKPGH